LQEIHPGTSTSISPWGLQGACCEALHLADTTGHVKIAISVVLTEAGNVKMAIIGRPKGNSGGGILDTMKTLLHRMSCGLGCGTFPVETAGLVHVSLVIGDLQ
jgi:hypothetical protein